MAGVREGQGQLVFGLDIGTRSIVGTVGYLSGGRFHVVGQRVREHDTRSMLDGQIHDINRVGETVNYVKEQLEEELNRKLTEVCIAAAGRVLRTVTTHTVQEYEEEHEVTEEDIYSLSTKGVEQAYEIFQKDNDSDMKFYCVGYTPMRYYMNGYQIGNLEGHKVRNMAVDLIATFLPDDVVDGLYKAVEIAGLHVANLTLEPIAAIQVAIPERFRMLNMALVDVGAGTSDISITKDGAITAYGMIPVAGDSLTEILVQHCLVDFDTAERIKRQAGERESVEYQDIMGLTQVISAREVEEILSAKVQEMTKLVADCIRELNGDKAVSAVFVVGGGGMIPGYTEQLAQELGIVKERVAIRGKEVMQNIEFEIENPRRDSLMVTPIGICLSYYEQSNNFIFVIFNGRRVKLYDSGKLSVVDAAVQSEFSNEELFPKRGQALTFTVNGKSRIVRGTQGEAAVIRVNGEAADIYTQIHNGDYVEVIASTAGDPASLELGRLPELGQRLHVVVNGTKIDLPKTASVNGRLENEYYQIRENDDIRVQNSYTVSEIAEFMDVPLGGRILVNDTPAKPDTRVYEGFSLSWNVNAEITYADLEDETEEEAAARRAAKEAAREAAETAARKAAEATVRAAAETAAMEAAAEGGFAGGSSESAGGFVGGSSESAGFAGGALGSAGGLMGGAAESVGGFSGGALGSAGGFAGGAAGSIGGFAGSAAGSTGGYAGGAAGSAGGYAGGMSGGTGGYAGGAAGSAGGYAGGMSGGTGGYAGGASGSAGIAGAAAGSGAMGSGMLDVAAAAERGPVDMAVIVNKLPVVLKGKSSYVFVDVFSFIDFDLNASGGRDIVTLLNGRNAEYMEPLSSGDVIEIYWEDRKVRMR